MLPARPRRRFAALVALGVAFACAPSPARAEPRASALVRLLHRPGRAHVLADASGRIPVTVTIPAGADARALGLLPVAPGIGVIRLAPERFDAFAEAHPELGLHVAPPMHALLDASKRWTHVDVFREVAGVDGTGVVVGVVDLAIDVRHPDFRDANGHTRIAWLLNSEPPRGLHPELEEAFGCADAQCAIYAAEDIEAILASDGPELRDHEGHGTHVTSIAAGNGGPMTNPARHFIGMAPNATLVLASPSANGGFYDADVLNAARFVFDRATALGMPAVMNLSLGGDYGSHDGMGVLEKGLSSMVGDDKPGRVIVAAAGNSGDLYDVGEGRVAGIHTEAHVALSEEVRVPIWAGEAKDGQGFVWITFRPGDEVEVALDGPGGSTWIGYVGKADKGGYKNGSDTGAIVNNLPSGNSTITADTNSAVVAWTGAWKQGSEFAVRLRGHGDASLWVVAGGDTGAGLEAPLAFRRGLRQGTINVPASAPGILAVGCTVNRVNWTPYTGTPIFLTQLGDDMTPLADSACYFSATGPTPFGVQKPEISAPGAFVAAGMSGDADPRKAPGGLFDVPGCQSPEPCYVLDDHHALAAGTSMSSPHVAGAAALLLQLDPTLTQARVTEVLQAGARRPTGDVPDPDQLGPGGLDLEGARQALAVERLSHVEPDVAKSWYTLSSAYLRPDESWPVWGTVELRRADGTIASGLDGTKLSLSVDGATVIKPLFKVRQGLFRFALAGREGEAGSTARVEVRYAGTSLGERVLPVGTDAWTIDGNVEATSAACGCHVPGGGAGGGAAAALLAIAAILRKKRR